MPEVRPFSLRVKLLEQAPAPLSRLLSDSALGLHVGKGEQVGTQSGFHFCTVQEVQSSVQPTSPTGGNWCDGWRSGVQEDLLPVLPQTPFRVVLMFVALA